ncbi:MAG: DUF92 domain-containing protein [Terriglobales bacterium]|jgi:uncharacterized protein (TIGR00297 family)
MADWAQNALIWWEIRSLRELGAATVVTLAFTALARFVRGVSFSGAIAGAVICFVLFASVGPGAFVALVSVFVLTWISTRLGYGRKQKLGTAQNREGRSASQVLANLSISAACAAVFALTKNAAFLLATAAALSEAAADTVSSELGQAGSSKARLITSWKLVPAGTNGGVSVTGTLAGAAAAVLVTLVCVSAGMFPLKQTAVPVMAALFGTIADSYLGATLERSKLLNNNGVNFLGTLAAAGGALLLA